MFVDHANLLHYWHSQKINRWVARYILTLADYNLEIHHCPGPLNKADALLQQSDYDDRKENNKNVTFLLLSLFIEALQATFLSLKGNKSPYRECYDGRDSSRSFHWTLMPEQDSDLARSTWLDDLIKSSQEKDD